MLDHPVANQNLFGLNHLLKMMAVEIIDFAFAFRVVLNLSFKMLYSQVPV